MTNHIWFNDLPGGGRKDFPLKISPRSPGSFYPPVCFSGSPHYPYPCVCIYLVLLFTLPLLFSYFPPTFLSLSISSKISNGPAARGADLLALIGSPRLANEVWSVCHAAVTLLWGPRLPPAPSARSHTRGRVWFKRRRARDESVHRRKLRTQQRTQRRASGRNFLFGLERVKTYVGARRWFLAASDASGAWRWE